MGKFQWLDLRCVSSQSQCTECRGADWLPFEQNIRKAQIVVNCGDSTLPSSLTLHCSAAHYIEIELILCITGRPTLADVLYCLQVSLQEACARCRHQWMREALQVWIERQRNQHFPCHCANSHVSSMQCPSKKVAAST